jgi:hypothetical protein
LQPKRPPTRGSFQKGQSGNPGGRRPIPSDVKEALRAACPEAVERLVGLLKSQDERVALAAAQTVIERALGRVPQSLDPIDSLTDAEAIAQAKLKLAV